MPNGKQPTPKHSPKLADVDALLFEAEELAPTFHATLRAIVEGVGGVYQQGPNKSRARAGAYLLIMPFSHSTAHFLSHSTTQPRSHSAAQPSSHSAAQPLSHAQPLNCALLRSLTCDTAPPMLVQWRRSKMIMAVTTPS